MFKAFLLVVAVGAGIGFMLPSGSPHADAPPAAKSGGPGKETLLERSPMGHFYTNAEIDGQLVRVVVDTGATSVALTTADAERIGIQFSPAEFTVIGSGASGAVRGKMVTLDRVSVDGKEVRHVPAAVLEGLEISLLGQAYLTRLDSVEMRGDYMRLQ